MVINLGCVDREHVPDQKIGKFVFMYEKSDPVTIEISPSGEWKAVYAEFSAEGVFSRGDRELLLAAYKKLPTLPTARVESEDMIQYEYAGWSCEIYDHSGVLLWSAKDNYIEIENRVKEMGVYSLMEDDVFFRLEKNGVHKGHWPCYFMREKSRELGEWEGPVD